MSFSVFSIGVDIMYEKENGHLEIFFHAKDGGPFSHPRDDYLAQIWWIFGKHPNEIHSDWRDPPLPFSENSLFLPPKNFRKNRNEIFRIGNDPPPHSEVFRKFIEFGTDSLPLVCDNGYNGLCVIM